jgi:predicted heme/steroid binding protein
MWSIRQVQILVLEVVRHTDLQDESTLDVTGQADLIDILGLVQWEDGLHYRIYSAGVD